MVFCMFTRGFFAFFLHPIARPMSSNAVKLKPSGATRISSSGSADLGSTTNWAPVGSSWIRNDGNWLWLFCVAICGYSVWLCVAILCDY